MTFIHILGLSNNYYSNNTIEGLPIVCLQGEASSMSSGSGF